MSRFTTREERDAIRKAMREKIERNLIAKGQTEQENKQKVYDNLITKQQELLKALEDSLNETIKMEKNSEIVVSEEANQNRRDTIAMLALHTYSAKDSTSSENDNKKKKKKVSSILNNTTETVVDESEAEDDGDEVVEGVELFEMYRNTIKGISEDMNSSFADYERYMEELKKDSMSYNGSTRDTDIDVAHEEAIILDLVAEIAVIIAEDMKTICTMSDDIKSEIKNS